MQRRWWRIGVWGLLAMAVPVQLWAVDFKIATVAPEGSQWMQEIRAAAALIKERTAGRAVIKLYGGGVMGNEKQVLRKIRIGQLQGAAFTASGIAEKYPDIVLYGLPLTFDNQDEVDFVRGQIDVSLEQGLEKAGFVSFGFASGGFARIFARQPIDSTDAMRGQKIWVPEGDRVSAAAMEALRLSPVALPVTDVLTGLQTGLLDIVAAPPVGVIALQWHTRVKFMTTAPLMYTMGMMAIDAKAFGKLNTADQQVFRETMSAVYRKLDQQSRADDAAVLKALQANGITLVEAQPAEVDVWRKAAAEANQRLAAEGVYTPALLKQMQTLLHEYRQRASAAAAAPAR